MFNKWVKSLLLWGLGLIGLTVALLGVGKAMVSQQRAQEQGRKWLEQLFGLESQVCPGEVWVYEVMPEGKMSLAFSYGFEEMVGETIN